MKTLTLVSEFQFSGYLILLYKPKSRPLMSIYASVFPCYHWYNVIITYIMPVTYKRN